jgi:hypothetical protein
MLARLDDDAMQFRSDFRALAHALIDPDWHKPPRPHGIATLPPFRAHAHPRRLPFGPLRRMTRLLGSPALRYVFAVGSDEGADFYRLELRPRQDKEFRRGNHYKRYEREARLIRFGNAVLERERIGGTKRGEALDSSAVELGIAASTRSLERYFRQFRLLCQRLGYVPTSLGWMEGLPRFALLDLEGRNSDKSEM